MLQTKALYNLLRLKKQKDPTVQVDSWAMEDLRKVSNEELFSKLEKDGVKLDKKSFLLFANESDTPEELTDLLFPDGKEEEKKDPFYLLVFELWRKNLPEKQSLSIFCDELDYQINLYDEDQTESDEHIQDALANLLDFLEANTDDGAEPKDVFNALTDYCAHDVESFIYDYTFELLDNENIIYSSELIEGFTPFVQEPLWFEFLNIRLLSFTDIGAANSLMQDLLRNDLDLSLLLEIIRFLSTTGDHELFKLSVQKSLPLIDEKDELMDIMSMIADYYRRLDEDDKEKEIQELINASQKRKFTPKDLKILQALLV